MTSAYTLDTLVAARLFLREPVGTAAPAALPTPAAPPPEADMWRGEEGGGEETDVRPSAAAHALQVQLNKSSQPTAIERGGKRRERAAKG